LFAVVCQPTELSICDTSVVETKKAAHHSSALNVSPVIQLDLRIRKLLEIISYHFIREI